MIETMLKTLRADLEMGGKIDVKVLDQGDAVGTWFNEDLFVVIFPTGETLPKVHTARSVAIKPEPLRLRANAAWSHGQLCLVSASSVVPPARACATAQVPACGLPTPVRGAPTPAHLRRLWRGALHELWCSASCGSACALRAAHATTPPWPRTYQQ